MEHWKPIDGYYGYEVSDLGNVRSTTKRIIVARNGISFEQTRNGTMLKPQPRRHGYLSVWLYNNDGGKQYAVHRLVAEAFCEKHEGDTDVNHINEDKTDNRAENLEWCDHKYNTNYGSIQAKRSKTITNGKCSKAVCQYTINGEFIKEYPSLAEAERQTGICKSSICCHLKGKPNYPTAGGYKWQYK